MKVVLRKASVDFSLALSSMDFFQDSDTFSFTVFFQASWLSAVRAKSSGGRLYCCRSASVLTNQLLVFAFFVPICLVAVHRIVLLRPREGRVVRRWMCKRATIGNIPRRIWRAGTAVLVGRDWMLRRIERSNTSSLVVDPLSSSIDSSPYRVRGST